MMSRRVYTEFGQFVAALKSAERLNLRYRVERREEAYTAQVAQVQPRAVFDLSPVTMTYTDEQRTRIVYTLDILADDDATPGE